MTLLLDASALLIRFFPGAGGNRVQDLLVDESNEILVASVCIAEFARRLLATGYGPDEARSAGLSYASPADRVVPVGTAAAVRTFELSSLSRDRIPLVDAIIASCAAPCGASLVHRDAHFREIPEGPLQRVDL